MGYKSFYTGIVIRVIVLLATCFLIGRIGFNSHYIHTLLFLYMILLLEIVWIVYYFNKTNRMLDRFFVSVFESGPMKFETLPGNESFRQLSERMEKFSQLIHVLKIQKENEYLYLKYVVEHLNTGILSLVSTGKIDLINRAGLKILGLERAQHEDDLKVLGKKFNEVIRNIRVGEQKVTQAIVHNEMVELSIRASEFKLFERRVKLISFNDIHSALDQKELDAWQKVIRVMAHEILSSVSPIHAEHPMTISRQLISIQGGQLDIQSRKGEGTTVTMTFEQIL